MNNIKFKDVEEIWNKYNEEYHRLKKVCEYKIEKSDLMIDDIYKKNKDNPEISEKDKEKLRLLTDTKLMNIRNEENGIYLFDEYFWSYLDVCILVRNDMILKKKNRLIYAYLFNLVHLLELNIKLLKLSNVNGFEEIKANHDLLKLYSEKKREILNLGLSEDYYNLLIKELEELSKFVAKSDIAMCFKYPIDKDFKTIIINKNITKINFEEINILIERHKNLLMIIGCIYILAKISNYNKIIEMLNHYLCEIEEMDRNIETKKD